MVRKAMATVLGICIVVAVGTGQPVAAQTFENLPGLERAVVRAYLAPGDDTSEVTLAEINDQGTPIGESGLVPGATPTVATPDPATVSGAVFLSVGIFEFDSPESATAAFDRLAFFAAEVSGSDPAFTGGSRTELEGIGDQTLHATAVQDREGIPFSYLFTVARSDRYVYMIQGTLVRLDATTEARRMLSTLIENPVGDTEHFDPDGNSTGGLWDKYIGIDPVLIEGSVVFDAVVFPTDVNASHPVMFG